MPPTAKIHRQDIVQAALQLVREQGAGALGARAVAAKLGCSTQPVFSNFPTMEELRRAVMEEALALSDAHQKQEMDRKRYAPYKAAGIAYITFAKKEPELFRLLYMQDRGTTEQTAVSFDRTITELAQEAAGIQPEEAELFHLEMWIFVHGLAVMAATGFFVPEEELISRMITDIFQGLRRPTDDQHN
ncbi:MAG: TetR/AcrR family transcriptional regulator [Ruminococcaceae bacterium]|nr:TetR/AcrR family transcriptional regulator [Oscillospiraceae bacterium]